MKSTFFISFCCMLGMQVSAQDSAIEASTHYEGIGDYPENLNAGVALARIVDGLGFRYYWGSKDLTSEDLAYRPSDEARSAMETLSHIHYMVLFMENTVTGNVTTFPEPEGELPFEALRSTTLQRIQNISKQLSNMDAQSISKLEMKIKAGEHDMQAPFWHFLQGPIGDAYYHLGQIVCYRRTTGNPVDPSVQPFQGKRVNS